MDDKKRPAAERIAGLDVRSSYRDIRDGIGTGATGGARISDQDIAAALGMVKTRCGKGPVWALETYFGSNLRHEHQLRALWADKTEHHSDEAEDRIRNRFACAIAVRQFAGVQHPASAVMEYAHLMCQRPVDFTKRTNEVLAWLEELRSEGLGALRKILAENRATLDTAGKSA